MEDSNSLKSKTITGLLWSFADLLANHGIQFIIQIILARLLLPQHFGIIGLVLVFIVISNSIVDSGFSQALIRDQNTSQVDYSTVFYFNLLVAFVMYGVLFNFSNAISVFFGEPQLTEIIRIISLVLIINSLGIIQKVILIKNIDFRTITKISIVAATISGGITITLAILGYGVWSLVINILAMQFVQMLLMWIFNKWIPSITFSLQSFKKFFVFGYKLLLSGLIDTFYNNILFLIIGKFYSSTQLGFYTNAVKFRDLATLSITASVQRVSYPILSSIQEDEQRLKSAFKMLIKTSAFINFPLMIGLVVIANPLFNLLLGEKWIPSVIYFQLLCLAGMLFPLHAINLNILQVKGRSDLFLLLEIIKKTVLTLLIAVSLLCGLGIVGLIGATVINSYISLFINAYYSSREIDYSAKEQLRDLMPVFLITLFMGVIVSVSGLIITENHFIKLIFQICIGLVVYVTVSKLAKVQELWIVYRLISSIFTKLKVKKI
ncbi:lipopolysaccharide biosynthesis protein [Paenisporosarcina macmurdoensis]|uniref:Lipopolysaccharide biosynthesis protein n=1 Tax=Paenisporosarcina macmurdoensis TaxID=212659 RepID=A0ABW1L8D4_9BACL